MNVDANYIKSLNDKVMRYNAERQKQLGAVEAAKKNLESGLASYNSMYGTQLTPETLNAELEKVSATIENEAKELEKLINYIESGAYKEEKPAPTPVTVTATDGTIIENPSTMPSTPVQPNVVSGVGVAPQNGTQGFVAPSTAIPANGVNPAVAPTPSPAPAVQQTTLFDTFTPTSAPAQPAPAPAPAVNPVQQTAPAGTGVFGQVPQPTQQAGNIPAPAWATTPTQGGNINDQFAAMLGSKFNPN